jgi:radical SAM superfamily enzyme YgiQ (UPF0313 family)
MIPVVGSRGCARRCAFCNDWIVWPNYRFRSAENIFTELLYHINNYTICDFEFVDLAINGKEAELGKLCDLIIANHIKINWVANFLIRPKINAGLFSKLRDAGCNVLRFGIESGSDKILKTMNKPFTIKDAEENLKQSYLAKIENHINLIVGYPGEDDNDFKATLSFVERNREFINRIANVHPCYLTPESELEKKYESYNIILPKESFSTHWYDKSGNTYAQRKARALEVKKLASRLDIQFEDKSALILLDEELAKEEKKFSGSLSKNE